MVKPARRGWPTDPRVGAPPSQGDELAGLFSAVEQVERDQLGALGHPHGVIVSRRRPRRAFRRCLCSGRLTRGLPTLLLRSSLRTN